MQKRYDELVPGDRVTLPYCGQERTVGMVCPRGLFNRDEQWWYVRYVECANDGLGPAVRVLPSDLVTLAG